MYDSIEKMKLALHDPHRILVSLNRLYHRRLHTIDAYPQGVDIFVENWDTLVILDACRYDSFKQVVNLPGRTEYRFSQGSTSKEFIRANFKDQTRYDTVYVSANAWYERLRRELESDLFRFVYVERDVFDGLSSKPETVTDAAIKAHRQHPKKRLIIHYMQPHQPFLGATGEKINHTGSLYTTVKRNHLSSRTVRKAYHENLQLVLSQMDRLFEAINGRTVITADHGELLGDRQRPIPVRDYGHPLGIYVDELVKVPWHVYEDGRREINAAEGPYSNEHEDMTAVEEHLSDLGYKV